MKLYHGTHCGALPSILSGGVRPRGDGPTNWGLAPSRPYYAYLTDAFALYFAFVAASIQSHGSPRRLLIVEVDGDRLDPALLRPDEDYLGQVFWTGRGALDLGDLAGASTPEEMLARIDVDEYACLADCSLREMGNVAHRGVVPPAAITRYALIDPTRAPLLCLVAAKPLVHTGAYRVTAPFYRSLIALAFDGAAVALPAAGDFDNGLYPDRDSFIWNMRPEDLARERRDGVEVWAYEDHAGRPRPAVHGEAGLRGRGRRRVQPHGGRPGPVAALSADGP